MSVLMIVSKLIQERSIVMQITSFRSSSSHKNRILYNSSTAPSPQLSTLADICFHLQWNSSGYGKVTVCFNPRIWKPQPRRKTKSAYTKNGYNQNKGKTKKKIKSVVKADEY